jgi:hypothetical protein
MLSSPIWILAATLSTALAAPGASDLRAVKAQPGSKKQAKRRTLQEWRAEQHKIRAVKAGKRPDEAPSTTEVPSTTQPLTPVRKPTLPVAKPRPVTHTEPSPTWMRQYARELQALLGLLVLWLITRIYGQSAAKKGERKAPRPSPVSDEELGRIVFRVGRGQDVDAYRALFLNGAEAMQILGADQAERYLSGRSLDLLETACEALATQLPSGSSYIKTEINPMHQCIIHAANPDGSGRTVLIGTVAQVGAVIRLVTPIVNQSTSDQD